MPAINSKVLSPDALEIVVAYAIAYPKRPARSKIFNWISNAGRQHRIRGMKPEEPRLAIHELVDAPLLAPSI